MPAARTLSEWLTYQQELHPSSIDLGLERVSAVARRLELLPPAGRNGIIGGTKGKGSTATVLAGSDPATAERVGPSTLRSPRPHPKRLPIVCVDSRRCQPAAAFG